MKIESQSEGKTTIIWLIGRIRAEDLDELKKQLENSAEAKILDLSELTIVDTRSYAFLASSNEKEPDSWAALLMSASGFWENDPKKAFRTLCEELRDGWSRSLDGES